MVTYWCTWCGLTLQRPLPDDRITCLRCAFELSRILGFFPATLMVPLEPGERPGVPAGARLQFEFRDLGTGEVAARTAVIPRAGVGRDVRFGVD